jgi:hypothetical protein
MADGSAHVMVHIKILQEELEKDQAPTNLPVPPYVFLSDNRIKIG